MNLRGWAEAIGFIGVIVSLGLLTWELNQANSLGRFTAHAEIMRHYNEINLQAASDADFGELLAVLTDEQAVLTKAQVQQTLSLAFWQRNLWANAELAYREGWISDGTYQETLNDIAGSVEQWPGIKRYLREVVRYTSPNREQTEVDKKILEVTKDG